MQKLTFLSTAFVLYSLSATVTLGADTKPESVTAAATTSTTTLTVEKMKCASCSDKVKAALLKIPGVEKVEVDSKASRVSVTSKTGAATTDQLIAAVKGVGFPATLTK